MPDGPKTASDHCEKVTGMKQDHPASVRLREIRGSIDAVLGPLIAPGAPIAIVGYPNHPNVGDGAIWVGEVAWLRERGGDVAFTCDEDGYRRDAMASALGPDGTILLHGGGNFGDLWPQHQLLREQVVRDFPEHRIVSLPQTMRFEDPAALERARSCFDGHDRVTLLFRDEQSLAAARDRFASPSLPCPDLALALGPRARIAPPRVERLWLSRDDDERRQQRLLPTLPGADDLVVDWLGDEALPERTRLRTLRRAAGRAGRAIARRPPPISALSRAQVRVGDALAAQRLHYGERLLCQGRTVVTDRLHAHVLCVVLGIPHVIVDTGYGKLRGFHEAWTAGLEFVRVADNAAAALAAARELAQLAPPVPAA